MRKEAVAAMAAEIERDLRAIRQILRQPVEAEIAKGGLTGPQQGVMSVLVRSGGMSLKDLSRQVGLAHSTVSGIVDRLEKQGLVQRETGQEDRRVSRITVTSQVRKFMQETWPSLEAHPLADALRSGTAAERREIREGIQALRRLLERRGKGTQR